MNLYRSKIYIGDLDKEIQGNVELFDFLNGYSILITGASGLVCSAIVDLIFRANQILGTDIKPFLAGRSRRHMVERFKKDDILFVPYDATKKNILDFHADYIIHGASNSGPGDIASHGIETMLDNFLGMYELLSYASKEQVRNTLYISSSEVYGKKATCDSYKEDDYGWVDILSTRSSYPSSKRAAETLCACFSDEKHIKTTIVRPGHVYGPTAKATDNHVCSKFIYDAVSGKNLVMKSTGAQIRSWCYCLDSAMAILTVLVKGINKNAYNISNPNSVLSIKEMAELLANQNGVKVIVENPQEEEKQVFNPMNNSSLNSTKLIKLGWRGLFDAKTGFDHSVQILKEACCIN